MSKNQSSISYDNFYNWVIEGYLKKIKIVRDKERIVNTNEIFTSLEFVLYGLELAYPTEFFKDPNISYSDNCVGEGAWLVGMALKRMKAGLSHEESIKNLFGVDIMQDNIDACRERLLCGQEHLRPLMEQNIQCQDALKYGYKFSPMGPARRKTEESKRERIRRLEMKKQSDLVKKLKEEQRAKIEKKFFGKVISSS